MKANRRQATLPARPLLRKGSEEVPVTALNQVDREASERTELASASSKLPVRERYCPKEFWRGRFRPVEAADPCGGHMYRGAKDGCGREGLRSPVTCHGVITNKVMIRVVNCSRSTHYDTHVMKLLLL